jgi:hypothetical protein
MPTWNSDVYDFRLGFALDPCLYFQVMKKITPTILLLLLPAFIFVSGVTIPSMEVTVTNAAGKVAYKGAVRSDGSFATGNLEPGNYVVEFDSKAKIVKGAKFALSAIAGKNNVSSDSVNGERILDPGVAMKISVAGNAKITGQVAPAGAMTKQATTANAKSKYTGPVKIINGKRYIWVLPYTGSVSGGRWVEEGSPEAMQAEGVNTGTRDNAPVKTTGSMKY